MSEKTDIGWTDHTFSPWWGCAHVSPGCASCYAEAWARRTGHDVWGKGGARRLFGDKHWREPLRWNAAAERDGVRRRVFCASMADVFEPRADLDSERAKLWPLIEATPSLDWLLLTKRPEEMTRMAPWSEWPPNVWAGTSVENQEWADKRIPELLEVPARIRFLSCEPLIGPVDLQRWLRVEWAEIAECWGQEMLAAVAGFRPQAHWIIVGGESGRGHRPMVLEWLSSIVAQCQAAAVPCFVKQDSGPRPGQQGRIPDELWRVKQWPESAVPVGAEAGAKFWKGTGL